MARQGFFYPRDVHLRTLQRSFRHPSHGNNHLKWILTFFVSTGRPKTNLDPLLLLALSLPGLQTAQALL